MSEAVQLWEGDVLLTEDGEVAVCENDCCEEEEPTEACADAADCETTTGNVIVDLGAGGWTTPSGSYCKDCDDETGRCEDIQGEFECTWQNPGMVSQEGDCWWAYYGNWCCQWGIWPHQPVWTWQLGILVQVFRGVSWYGFALDLEEGEWQWLALVRVDWEGPASPNSFALYASEVMAGDPGDDCWGGAEEIELTKRQESHGFGQMCAGTLPATIVVRKG